MLDLSHSNLSLEAFYDIANVLHKNTRIEQLWMENNKIPDDGLIAILMPLTVHSRLILISLRGSISSPELITLATLGVLISTCVTIKHLYLGNNDLCDKGLRIITSDLEFTTKQGLHTLDLSNTNITEVSADCIVAVIHSSSQLQQLFLGNNKLCSSGAIKIVPALQGSYTIQVLGLSHNHITCEAAGEISIAVSSMPYLSTMMLDSNELGVDGVCTIIEGVQELNWLMILSVSGNVNSEEEEEYLRMKFAD